MMDKFDELLCNKGVEVKDKIQLRWKIKSRQFEEFFGKHTNEMMKKIELEIKSGKTFYKMDMPTKFNIRSGLIDPIKTVIFPVKTSNKSFSLKDMLKLHSAPCLLIYAENTTINVQSEVDFHSSTITSFANIKAWKSMNDMDQLDGEFVSREFAYRTEKDSKTSTSNESESNKKEVGIYSYTNFIILSKYRYALFI